MPFLPPNQQRQSANYNNNNINTISSQQPYLAHQIRMPTLPALTMYPRLTSPSLKSAILVTSLSTTSTDELPSLITAAHGSRSTASESDTTEKKAKANKLQN